MNYSIRQISGPSTEPVTLVQAKTHLRVDATNEDAYITALITAARTIVENEMSRPIGSQQFELALEGWPNYFSNLTRDDIRNYGFPSQLGGNLSLPWLTPLRIPKPPLISVDSITYKTYSPVATVTLATSVYDVDTASEPGQVILKPAQTWPADALYPGNSVKVAFTAGLVTIPQSIIAAMYLVMGHLYEHREAVTIGTLMEGKELPLALRYILMPERYLEFA